MILFTMARSLTCALIAAAVVVVAATAQSSQTASQTTPTSHAGSASPATPPETSRENSEHNVLMLDKPEMFRRIGIFENVARNAAALHATHEDLIQIYLNLGTLYGNVGNYPRAEAAMKRAIQLMKDGPQDALAEEINRLSQLHCVMGKLRDAEKDQEQALAVREKIGDPVGIAITWSDISNLYGQQRKAKKSLEYAQKAYDVLGGRSDLNPSDHIAAVQTLAFALCQSHQCARAIPLMKQAVDIAKSTYGENSLSVACEGFTLGFVYWHAGKTAEAADLMERSLKRMKVDLGWGHVIYVNAMTQYAQFLRETGRREAAFNAESEIDTMKSMVDARTLTTRGGEFLAPGSR